ncbi:MAG: adenosylcobalamin-dependent ribonucleoside-diphosphate reductase, partial [Candidatus Methylomirabilales bacterium]
MTNFTWLLSDFRMIPGGRIMTGAGNPRGVTLANCYVLASPQDSIEGIFQTAHEMAETYKRGGGCGFDISTLRPNGTLTRNAALTSSGAVSFMHLFSTVTGTIGQLGRRGALMISIGDTHPDVLSFTRVKRDLTTVKFANISVRLSDPFMKAVAQDDEWLLEYVNEPDRIHVQGVIKARQLWDEIITGATQFAEPGVLFWDTVTRGSTSEYDGMHVVSTNPCSEIPQGANHNCTLANVNLAAFCEKAFTPQARIMIPELLRAVSFTVRFLDDVLDYNADRHALSAQRAASLASRRIGVGFTGLADLFIQLGLRYNSEDAVTLTDTLFREIKLAAYATSVSLAQEKGVFPAFSAEKHLASRFFAEFPEQLLDAIRSHGLRNVALLTVPPVGSGAALAGVTSGIEPVFALQYVRRSESLSQGEFTVEHPLVTCYRAITHTTATEPLPPAFLTAHEIDYRARIAIQAALQAHIDMGISSTVNVPRDTTPETVAKIYHEAWEAGCKGITVYREGSRDGILLTKQEAATRQHAPGAKLATEINRLVGKILPANAKLSTMPTEKELAQFAQAIDSVLKSGPAQLDLMPTDRPLRPRP